MPGFTPEIFSVAAHRHRGGVVAIMGRMAGDGRMLARIAVYDAVPPSGENPVCQRHRCLNCVYKQLFMTALKTQLLSFTKLFIVDLCFAESKTRTVPFYKVKNPLLYVFILVMQQREFSKSVSVMFCSFNQFVVSSKLPL